ncbi:MAG: hypothetical protein F6K11_30400 [Leptolyngbya sp. SIO3F4]|nr:hypothetical protein [Leptolyngbya sp. SIO3F4]
MNLIKLSPAVAVTAISCLAIPVQAFTIVGNPDYSKDGLPTELSVNNEAQILDGDTQFTVENPNDLRVDSLLLEGSLDETGISNNSIYAPVLNYITGFEFLGTKAIFNLDAGKNVFAGFVSSSNFILDSFLSGDIVDLDGNILGTAVGSFSAVQTGNQIGNFSINLEGTPINLDTPDATSVPSPGSVPGIIGLTVSLFWKPKHQLAE